MNCRNLAVLLTLVHVAQVWSKFQHDLKPKFRKMMGFMGQIDRPPPSGTEPMGPERKALAEGKWPQDDTSTTKSNRGKWNPQWWGPLYTVMVGYLRAHTAETSGEESGRNRTGIGAKKTKLKTSISRGRGYIMEVRRAAVSAALVFVGVIVVFVVL